MRSRSPVTLGATRRQLDLDVLGRQMYACIEELYPLCRSITGDGVRETLRRIRRRLPLTLHEVPTGVPVFDWTVPNEWNIRDAWVKNASGERVVDFQKSNLHVVSYSVPVRARMALAELKEHLHALPESPDRIPYRTSYYRETWGFCLTQRQLDALPDAEYEVCIDSTLAPGSLSYGECYLPGETADGVLERGQHLVELDRGRRLLSGQGRRGLLLRRFPCQPPLLVPSRVHPRHHRLPHVAVAQRGQLASNQGRARPDGPRRSWNVDL